MVFAEVVIPRPRHRGAGEIVPYPFEVVGFDRFAISSLFLSVLSERRWIDDDLTQVSATWKQKQRPSRVWDEENEPMRKGRGCGRVLSARSHGDDLTHSIMRFPRVYKHATPCRG